MRAGTDAGGEAELMAKGTAKKSIWRRWWVYPLIVVVLLIIGEAALFTAVAVNARRMDNPSPADAMIVLGARVYDDGSPSPALQRRLDRAAELYAQGYAPVIVVSGGQGDDEPEPEGTAMKRYLVAQGVPEAQVIAETESYSTQENLENSKAILDGMGLSSVIVVTSDYHLWRALSMAKDAGFTEATGAGSQNALTWPVAVRNCLQETVSWVKYVLTR